MMRDNLRAFYQVFRRALDHLTGLISRLERLIGRDSNQKFAARAPVKTLAGYGLFVLASNASLAQDRQISFAKEIAPILRENCKGCHIGGQQASGGLRMDSFAQLMRGGSSGAIIEPRQATQSLLVRKLTGAAAGQRMPAGGRSALAPSQIQTISSWIDSGADYDGPSLDTNIETVVNLAWASDATHAELFSQRQQCAQERWKHVSSDQSPNSAQSKELFALGNVSDQRLQEVLSEFQKAVAGLKKQSQVPEAEPLLRGGLVLFVLKSRYDYSEFGRMVEKRELPRTWSGHWRADPADAYAVLVDESSSNVPLQALATHLVTGAYWGSHPEVPHWFAEGIARNQVAAKFRKNDPRVATWQAELPAASARVSNAKELIEGKFDEDSIGLIGMAMTDFMLSRSNRSRYQALIKKLRSGTVFSTAMERTFGDTETFVKGWIGR